MDKLRFDFDLLVRFLLPTVLYSKPFFNKLISPTGVQLFLDSEDGRLTNHSSPHQVDSVNEMFWNFDPFNFQSFYIRTRTIVN